MIKRLALAALAGSAVLVALAYASAFLPGGAPAWAAWLLAFGTAGSFVAIMALGAARDGRLGRLVYPFAFVFIVVAAGFGAVLAMPPADTTDPALWMGLPPRAAIVLYGIGLVPLFVVPVFYALTFDDFTLTRADIERVRQAVGAPRDAVDSHGAADASDDPHPKHGASGGDGPS